MDAGDAAIGLDVGGDVDYKVFDEPPSQAGGGTIHLNGAQNYIFVSAQTENSPLAMLVENSKNILVCRFGR